jgi:5-formyltetrahydrofolate cyclo-ligase
MLRKQTLARRDALDSARCASAAEMLATREMPFTIARGIVVSGYVAMRSELNPRPLMLSLRAAGANLALPTIVDDRIVFRAYEPGDPLVQAVFGTFEPKAERQEVEPDVVLAPLVAFDAAGFRLGYGKGYYDQALARLRRKKQIVAVGLAFEAQRVGNIPRTPRDQRLDYVLTEAALVVGRTARKGR